jgi:hypothetical protein
MSLSKMIEPSKPWSVAEFQLYRPYISKFVNDNIVQLIENDTNEIRRLLIHGEVKSGKREIVEYIAMRDKNSQQRVHIFLSSFHRAADESQRKELAQHNLIVCSIIDKEVADKAIKKISDILREGKVIIIHLDECDYGTGSRQNLKTIYGRFKQNRSVITILYSATPEELLFSQDITQSEEDDNFIDEIYEEGLRLYYIPPSNYCGAKKFIDEGLVSDARPFFEKTIDGTFKLSNQAKNIIADAKENIEQLHNMRREQENLASKAKREGNIEEYNKRKANANNIIIKNIIQLRLTYKTFGSTNLRNGLRSLEAFVKNKHAFPELDDCSIILDKSDYKTEEKLSGIKIEQVKWSERTTYWDFVPDKNLIIVVNEQTSTRSTEWAFHDRIFATHDYRPNISYGTIAQAQLRVAHYYGKMYREFQRIRVYGHLKTFLLAAKMISVTDYLNDDWKKIQIKKDVFNIGEKVKFKHEGIEYDSTIVSYDPEYKKYDLQFNMNGKMFKAENIGKCDIKAKKESKKFNIKNSNDDTIHSYYNEEYNEETADKILEELGCNIKIDLSSRVKGKSKSVLKIESMFIECDETNVSSCIQESIKNNTALPKDVRDHNFNTNLLFSNFEINESGQKKYKGTLRSIKNVYYYEEIKKQRWGFNEENKKPRLTVCYNEEKLGLCLRYTKGEKEDVTTLSSYLSMYQPLK